jgi:hypothetical protein
MKVRICVTHEYEVEENGDNPLAMAAEMADLIPTIADAMRDGEAFVRVEVVCDG